MYKMRPASRSTALPWFYRTMPFLTRASDASQTEAIDNSVRPDHRNNFNLIRLFAALQVLCVHIFTHFEYGGPLVEAIKLIPGVPTFFFISGYLIYSSYKRTKSRGLRAFATNRLLRIYPALWVCIVVSTLSVVVTGYLSSQTFSSGLFAFWLVAQGSILQFYNPDFMRDYGVGVLNGALWTISVELQFYILTPLLFYFLHFRRAVFAWIFFASLALNLYFRFYLDWDLLVIKLIYVSFASWVFMYMMGFIAAEFATVREWARKIPYMALVAGIILCQNFVGSYEMNASNGINPITFAILGLLIVKFSTQKMGVFTAFQNFIERSDFSYGLYLYHMPIINFLVFTSLFSTRINAMIVLPAALTAAALSWYLIEKPALRHKK